RARRRDRKDGRGDQREKGRACYHKPLWRNNLPPSRRGGRLSVAIFAPGEQFLRYGKNRTGERQRRHFVQRVEGGRFGVVRSDRFAAGIGGAENGQPIVYGMPFAGAFDEKRLDRPEAARLQPGFLLQFAPRRLFQRL